MRIPSNLITKNQYTIGGEFIYLDTYEDYQGYYYILSDKFFEGKEFKTDSRELISVYSDKAKKLRINNITFSFPNLKLPNNKLPSFIYRGQDPIRYFAKKINSNPILIKEISKDTFDKIQTNPMYQTIALDFTNLPSNEFANSPLVNNADKKMPGLKTFLIG